MKQSIGIALALSLFLLPSCSKDKKTEAEKTTTESPGKTTEGGETPKDMAAGKAAKIALTPAAPSAELGSILKHMPADTEVLVAMNLASLTGTPLWKQLGPAAMAQAGGGLAKAKETCGFDPITKLTSVHFGINSASESEAVVIVKGLTRGPLIKCIKSLASMEKAEIEVTEDGNFTTVKGKKESDTLGVVWLDDNTLLMVPGKVDKPYLQARYDGKDGLAGNADFLTSAAKANQSAPIWFAGRFDTSSKAAKGMASLGGQPQALYGSIAFNDGIQFALGVTFVDENTAKSTLGTAMSMMGMAKGSMGPMAGLVDKVQLVTKGADLYVTLDMNKEEVDQLSNMASMFTEK